MYGVLQLHDIQRWNYVFVMGVRFKIHRWIFQLLRKVQIRIVGFQRSVDRRKDVQNKNSLLSKINCKAIASMTVSNLNELWVAIQNNENILTFWCCNHVIPCLYEKEHTNTHGHSDPPEFLLLLLGIKAQKTR